MGEAIRDLEPNGAAEPTAIETEKLGLCSTCNTIVTCTGRRTWRGPVFFCEEFDDHVETPDLRSRPLKVVAAATTTAPATTAERSGICVNCELLRSCRFPTLEGGVWHCEEYR